MARVVKGGCLCGAVTFTVSADDEVGVCHCSMCQRWTAGPFLAVEADAGSLLVEGTDGLGVYHSSDWGERCFCKACGTALLWCSRDGEHLVVSAGALDDKTGLRLVNQIYIDEKPDYYTFANETVNMTGPEFVAMMTGTAAKSD